MIRVTLAKVNAAIAERGIRAELVKGRGYFYFAGDDVAAAFSTSVMVCQLGQLTLAQWLGELSTIVEDARERAEYGRIASASNVLGLPAE